MLNPLHKILGSAIEYRSLVRMSYTKIIYLYLLGVLKRYIRFGVLIVGETLVYEMKITLYKSNIALFNP